MRPNDADLRLPKRTAPAVTAEIDPAPAARAGESGKTTRPEVPPARTTDGAQALLPADSVGVRQALVEALRLDLVGPTPGHALAAERLPAWERPSKWYLTGFLVPAGAPPEQAADADENEEVGETPEAEGDSEDPAEDGKGAKKSRFPSSLGLSFLAPDEMREVEVVVRWGDYELAEHTAGDPPPEPTPEPEAESKDGGGQDREEREESVEIPAPESAGERDSGAEAPADATGGGEPEGKTVRCWRRLPRERSVTLTIGDREDAEVPDSGGLRLHLRSRPFHRAGETPGMPAGVRSVSVFLSNRRSPAANKEDRDLRFAFQAQIEVRADLPFVPMPDLRGAGATEFDEQVADLHYRDAPEYAVGHGVSPDWEFDGDSEDDDEPGGERPCRRLRTEWIGRARVERVETEDVPDAVRSMDVLGELPDGDAARAALTPLVERYREWIGARREEAASLPQQRRETATELLRQAGIAATRMERGIETLTGDADLLDAFRLANRAVAAALRAPGAELGDAAAPEWRSFQLAFLLLNLPALADPAHPERALVDLLFFPTGGGKTEAYLGLAAIAMVLRRLRYPEDAGRAGAGVSVIMRYTLRLLTLDQLARASRLVCALELAREEDPGRYGEWPFEIGLWVGKAATPNRMGKKGDKRDDTARAKVGRFGRDGREPPVPLASCPWCGEAFAADSFQLEPDADRPRNLRLSCADYECAFSGDRPLPVVAVDEPLYRRLPAFLIATVDKFAALPWTGESGLLLGGADRRDAHGFHGPAAKVPGRATRLPVPLPPPDLVIQDEVHLISGPLGTMVGLYETTIGALCSGAGGTKPKIVASTATSRGAEEQMQAVFGRPRTKVFPPPGTDRRDSFFARAEPSPEKARLYLGLAAPGRSPKVLMRRAALALMGAAQRSWRDNGGKVEGNPADPYLTLLGYFNSLRELGGARRIFEEEVRNTIKSLGMRKRVGEKRGLFRDRRVFSDILELTSRVSTGEVARARRRLGLPFSESGRVDCALATNMISVGLDIQRLGLMVVLGQPKVHAEYIQATSRVGRDAARPGLVVTLLSVHKPRDRSHYERFRHYHETFYRSVESASVTPFSPRALDRGFAGALVALARHGERALTPWQGAGRIAEVGPGLRESLASAFANRIRQQRLSEEEREAAEAGVRARTADLLESWERIRAGYIEVGDSLRYQKHEGGDGKPLLREMLDTGFESADHAKFRANRSLREVEPEVNVFVRDPVVREAPAK